MTAAKLLPRNSRMDGGHYQPANMPHGAPLSERKSPPHIVVTQDSLYPSCLAARACLRRCRAFVVIFRISTCPRGGTIKHENAMIGQVFAPASILDRPPPGGASVGDLAQRWCLCGYFRNRRHSRRFSFFAVFMTLCCACRSRTKR